MQVAGRAGALAAVDRAFRRWNLWAARVAGVVILGLTAFTLYGVFTRYILRDPDTWSYPVASYLLLFLVFLATARAHEAGDHVSVDYLLTHLKPTPRRFATRIGDIATLVFLAVFLWQLTRLFLSSLMSRRIDETMLGWPLAAIQWVMPLGAALLLVTHVLKMLRGFQSQDRTPMEIAHD